jgi:starch synthase
LNYSADKLAERKPNKRALQAELALAERDDVPLIGMVTRLVDQKGIDILIPAIRYIMDARNAQFVVLGSGMPQYEDAMRWIANDFSGRAAAETRFNEPLSERIYAGSDLFLMPSLFEPCGIGQMLAMRFGSLPVVRRVGGLADTVDPSSGFLFGPYDVGALIGAINNALDVYTLPSSWKRMQRTAMKKDFAWESSARRYLDLYRIAVDVHRAYA